jgi:hypothetical protein
MTASGSTLNVKQIEEKLETAVNYLNSFRRANKMPGMENCSSLYFFRIEILGEKYSLLMPMQSPQTT